MTTTATPQEHLARIVQLWPHLEDMLTTHHAAPWPPAGRLTDYLAALDQADAEQVRQARELEVPAGQPPIRLAILDTARAVERVLLDTADQIASSVQRPAARALPAARPSLTGRASTCPAAHPGALVELADGPRCICCHCLLFADEWGRQACVRCQSRTGDHLAALAGPEGLYARLSAVLAPGRVEGGPSVSGSRTAPLPLRLEPLSLSARGGVVTILQSWLIDWHEILGYTHPRWNGDLQQQCDQAAARLRANLPWAASSHPAFDEFAREVAAVTAACRRQITGERPERRVPVVCGCGTTLRITVSTPGARCRGCGQQYAREDVLQLPLAERHAA